MCTTCRAAYAAVILILAQVYTVTSSTIPAATALITATVTVTTATTTNIMALGGTFVAVRDIETKPKVLEDGTIPQ